VLLSQIEWTHVGPATSSMLLNKSAMFAYAFFRLRQLWQMPHAR